MNWRISMMILSLLLVACKQEQVKEEAVSATYLIGADALNMLIDQPNIKIIDFRKKEAYQNEHIAGALNIWRTDIEDSSYAYKGMMPSQAQLELLFGKLGIATEDTLVVYDDNGLCEATRLWWILQNYDFKSVRLLTGGIAAWKANGGAISTEVPKLTETEFKLAENPKMHYYVSKEEVQEAINNNVVIVDTRTIEEFSGKRQKKGAAKGGRIPKSIHIDWAEAINYNGDQRLKSLQDLDIIYSELNINKEDPVIVYCHTGVRSAHTAFVLTQLLGYKNVRNYDGSWTEWSFFNDLPIEKDSITTIKN